MLPAEPAGLVFLRGVSVPPRWRNQAFPGFIVVLSATDAEQLGGTQPVQDVELELLLAQGRTISAIAERLGLSARTVQRRVGQLRRRLGVESKADLAALLARRDTDNRSGGDKDATG